MQSKHNFSSVNKNSRSLCDKTRLSEEIPVFLGSDSAHISPVVLRGQRKQVDNACITF